MNISHTSVVEVDLSCPEHQEATVCLINAFSMDPMSGSKPLSEAARRALIPGLQQHPTTLVFLAYQGSEPVGIAVCFRGFSTFAARPLINIHDFFVVPASRGAGIGRCLLDAVEQRARAIGCCKLTLEVKENNHRAKGVYFASGFSQEITIPEAGGALYLAKPL